MGTSQTTVERMQALVQQWEESADARAIFLRCYMMMTINMLAALQREEFKDPLWVDVLLQRFAERYFDALDAFEANPDSTPAAWRLAYEVTRGDALALQKLLLGVNAHINYDLALTLVDLLQSEWLQLHEVKRGERYYDFCYVNDVIGRTIDAVQDTILDPIMPGLDIADAVFGRLDEDFVSRLITRWRDQVWTNTIQLLETATVDEHAALVKQLEHSALRHAGAITLTDWRAALDELI